MHILAVVALTLAMMVAIVVVVCEVRKWRS